MIRVVNEIKLVLGRESGNILSPSPEFIFAIFLCHLGVLFYCISPKKSHACCLQVALENQADVNNVSSEGVHVFQLMCEKALVCTPICLMMVDAGADPNAKDTVEKKKQN